MKKSIIVIISFLLFPLCVNAKCNNGLHVSETVRKTVKPDIAYITLYAQTDATSMEGAAQKTNRLVENISIAVKKDSSIIKGIKIKNVFLDEHSNRGGWRQGNSSEPPHPQVTKQIRIYCEPVPQKIYKIIDKGIQAGASIKPPSTISHKPNGVVVYGLVKTKETFDKMEAEAIENAKEKAEELAKREDKVLGDIVRISYSQSGSSDFISYTISLTYSLK